MMDLNGITIQKAANLTSLNLLRWYSETLEYYYPGRVQRVFVVNPPLGTAAIIGGINGALPVNFWTLHAFQISATLDMLLFMRVLGLRTKELHTKVQHANQQLDAMHSLAHTDPLTGLPNRRGFELPGCRLLARHVGRPDKLALLFVDLDGFKASNDRFGHAMGDDLLQVVAARLHRTSSGTKNQPRRPI